MKRLLPFLLLTLTLPTSLFAQDISPAEQRLRDTLRNTMLQLRTAQTERANLQADKIQNEAKIQQLETQVEGLNKKIVTLNKDASAEQEASKKKLDGLQVKSDAQEKQIAQLKEALDKWKAGYAEAVKIAKEREALRAKAASKAVLAERKLAERERQNLELYETGSEVLERLQNFGLGTALTAREPFVGVTRVKLQNLVQDYGDRLRDSKYNPFLEDAAKPEKASEATEAEKKNAAEVQAPKKS
ncbi:MAG: phage major capsid protein [Verrucomicrobiota bacterium]